MKYTTMIRSAILVKMISFLVLFASCGNTENNKLIIGKWSGTAWLVDGKPSELNAAGTHFNFNDKGEYTFEYNDIKENGTYKVENDMLFTTASGQKEMMVKITRISKDSLVFDMSREGQPETLILLRK